VLGNGLLLTLLLVGLLRGRVNVPDVPHRCFLANHVTVQLLTSLLVVPLIVAVERGQEGWGGGKVACRVWILARLLLAAANFWSELSVVLDRFLSVAAAPAYRFCSFLSKNSQLYKTVVSTENAKQFKKRK